MNHDMQTAGSFPDEIKIGPLCFKSPVFLAPMAGYTDLLFRSLLRRLGGLGLAYTEMISPHSLLRGGGRKLAALLATDDEDRPLCHQLYGSDAEVMAEGAKKLEDSGALMIDINMGCPKRKIVRNGSGVALLEDASVAVRMAETVVRAVSIPVSVKVRLGLFSNTLEHSQLLRHLEEAGVAAVTIHGRTGEQGYTGKADWEAIRQGVAQAKTIPVIGNGDIISPESARALMELTGCKAVMIGREALKNPWVIRDIGLALAGKPGMPPPTRRERATLALEHFEATVQNHGNSTGLIIFRKWLPQIARDLKLSRKEMVRWLCFRQKELLRDELCRLIDANE